MLRKLGLIIIGCSLTACSFFNLDNNKNEDRLARCKEIRHRIIFNGATSNQMVGAQQKAEKSSLERDYKRYDCN